MTTLDTTLAPASLAARLRTPFIGLLSGLLAALLNAVIARLLMRVVALAMGGRGDFTIEGTAVIFMFGALLGPLLGLLFVGLRRWLPAHWLLRAGAFALILAAVFQLPIFFIVPDFAAEIMAVGGLGLGVFALINLAFCGLLAWIHARLDQRWPADSAGREVPTTIGTVILGLLAAGGLAALAYELGGRLIGVVD